MVMENEIRLGDILDKLTPSDRLVIYNAARQVVYRGYAANAVYGTVNPQRRIKKMGLGMETYRATDWKKCQWSYYHCTRNGGRRWQQVKRFWNCGRQNHNAKHRSGCWYT